MSTAKDAADESILKRLGLPEQSWLEQALKNAVPTDQEGRLHIGLFSISTEFEERCNLLTEGRLSWQRRLMQDKKQRIVQFTTESGPHVLVNLAAPEKDAREMLECTGEYALARDLMGQVFALLESLKAEQITIDFMSCSEASTIGCLTGLEMAAYDYRNQRGDRDPQPLLPGLHLELPQSLIDSAIAQGLSVNVARHLVNLPAADLNPETYARLVFALFEESTSSTVTIWDAERLKEEKMGLMLAVGKAAVHQPSLIHIRYRKKGATARPLALVGKGITFDTGGLDLKPSAFMRMMKKDMGGSAALVGLAVWLDRTAFAQPVDIWLAVAENAVGQKAFRPGDVITARNGKTVEIDNTDAEGRLVLADALTVAVSEQDKNRPAAVVDVATLTGAARVALGLQIGALFANNKSLSDALYSAGIESGDPLWPLPLVRAYETELQSHVAQLVNCSTNRFGGAVTAAMFLEEFSGDIPWAHIDVNAWTNETQGPVKGPGANGQMVQCLIKFVECGFEC